MSDLADMFAKLRETRGLSQAEVARRSSVDKSTVWKLEQGRSIRAPTLRQICMDGLGLGDESSEYKRLLALWTMEQGNVQFDLRSIGRAKHSRQRELDRLADDVAAILDELPVGERKAIVRALADPGARRVLLVVAEELAKKGQPAR